MLCQLSYEAKSVRVCGISELSLVPSIMITEHTLDPMIMIIEHISIDDILDLVPKYHTLEQTWRLVAQLAEH